MSDFPPKGSPELAETRPNFPTNEEKENILAMMDGLIDKFPNVVRVIPKLDDDPTNITYMIDAQVYPQDQMPAGLGEYAGVMVTGCGMSPVFEPDLVRINTGYVSAPMEINEKPYTSSVRAEEKVGKFAKYMVGDVGDINPVELPITNFTMEPEQSRYFLKTMQFVEDARNGNANKIPSPTSEQDGY